MKPVFVNSLPKSGTNLVAKCLNLLGYRERGHLSAGTVLDRNLASRARRALWKPRGAGYLLGINTPVETRRAPIAHRIRRLRDGEFVTAHLGYTHDLLRLSLDAGCAAVAVIRDPRAVMASSVPYFLDQPAHFLHREFARMDPVERYRAVLHGYFDDRVSLQPMRTCLLALDPWLRHQRVHTVRFEQLVGAAGGGSADEQLETLGGLCRYVGAEPDDLEATAAALFGPGRHTFRKGQIDSWREEIPAEVMPEVEQELGELLEAWGYART